MFYSEEITVPANTTRRDYQETAFKVTKGIITRIAVFFPWGCAGLVYVQIARRTWQVFPLTRDEWISGNDKTIDFKTNIELTSEPYDLMVRMYNLDDTYEHSPIIMVEMVSGGLSDRFTQNMAELGL